MSDDLVYVPANEDDAEWWEQTAAPQPLGRGAAALGGVERSNARPQSSTRVDLVLYLRSLTPAEAIAWLEHGRPDGRFRQDQAGGGKPSM